MRLLRLSLALVATAGWWAWRDHRARLPTGVLQGGDHVPPPPDTTRPAVDPPRTGTVARLPRGSGRIQGSKRRARVQTGLRSAVSATGTMAWMTGAHSVVFDVDAGVVVAVEASVERGRLRVYLRESLPRTGSGGVGYRYAEAVPGAPLRLSGPLITGTSGYLFYAEAVGGRAERVAWSVAGGG